MSYYSSEDIGHASLADIIISVLLSAGSTRLLYRELHQQVKKRRKIKDSTFYQNIYRLKKNNLAVISGEYVSISSKGKKRYVNFQSRFLSAKPEGNSRVLVLFDIPEHKRKIRRWLRDQLKEWDFELVQKSVWIGQGSLPKEFGEYLVLLGIKDNVKVYPIRKNN